MDKLTTEYTLYTSVLLLNVNNKSLVFIIKT